MPGSCVNHYTIVVPDALLVAGVECYRISSRELHLERFTGIQIGESPVI